MSRTDDAYGIMQKIYLAGMRAGDDKHQIARNIDRAYPWGERTRWPYKAWLKARRQFFTVHGLPGLRRTKEIARVDPSPYTPASMLS